MSQKEFTVIEVCNGNDVAAEITPVELARRCGCQRATILRLVELELVEPVAGRDELAFNAAAMVRVRKALRLKRDLQLNFHTVALVMSLLDRIDELERQR